MAKREFEVYVALQNDQSGSYQWVIHGSPGADGLSDSFRPGARARQWIGVLARDEIEMEELMALQHDLARLADKLAGGRPCLVTVEDRPAGPKIVGIGRYRSH